MTDLVELTIHIHASGGLPCAACGDSDNGTRAFLTDVGVWNTTNDKCSPGMILKLDYEDSNRDRPESSALLGERIPPRKKVDDPR